MTTGVKNGGKKRNLRKKEGSDPSNLNRVSNMKKRNLHHYEECGLDYVYLANGFTISKEEGGEYISIDGVNDLHRAISHDIICNRPHLQGQEFRFLRTELGFSQVQLGVLLGVDSQTVARWEKDEHSSGTADRAIRMLYLSFNEQPESLQDVLRQLSNIDDLDYHENVFEEREGEWRLAA